LSKSLNDGYENMQNRFRDYRLWGLDSARADQPHMRRAPEHLRAARAELQSAEHNKGGWRARPLSNVDKAIADTEKGMAVAR
jgi:hypothetical protein